MNHPQSEQTQIATELAHHELMAPFNEEQLTAIAEVARRVEFTVDQQLYEERSDGHDFLLVGSGELEARRETPLGSQAVGAVSVGDIAGEISMLDGKPRSSSVIAKGNGHVILFPADAVARLIGNSPEIEVAFLRIFCRSLARKIRQANQVMTQIMAPDTASTRVARGTRGQHDAMDEAAKLELLRDQGMSRADLEQLATYLEAESFVAGDSIFVEGEGGDTLYIVADGKVRISRHIPGMGEEALAILDRGEVFGEMAWIDASPRSADAIAHTGGCTVLGISRTHLDGTLGQRPETHAQFLKLLCQVLCRRVRNMNDQLVAYRTMAFF